MRNFCENLTREDIANALEGAKELLAILNCDGRSIADVIKTAHEQFGEIEINGETFYKFTPDGKIQTSYAEEDIDLEDVEWLRVSEFSRGQKGDLMYCYLWTNGHRYYDGSDKSAKAARFVPEELEFDFYPNPETDEYVDALTMDDCEKILRGEMEIPK